MTDTQAILDEFASWVMTESVKGQKDVSPQRFLAERHTRGLLVALQKIYRDGFGEGVDEEFEEEDLAWLNAQEFAALSVDRTK